jgi:hypothetical protein
MTEVLHFEPGNYDFVHAPGGPFSSGVAPMRGFALRRVRFGRPIPMAEGFAFIEVHLGREGRPLTALAACELRSPAAMTVSEFQAFNRQYLYTLHTWGCRLGEINTLENTQDFTGRFESKKWEPQPNQFYLILIVILSETSGGLNG